MSSTFGSQPASGKTLLVNGRSPWVWALRRAVAGILILAVTVGGAAWLLYATIDQEAEAGTEARALRKVTIEAPAGPSAASVAATLGTTGALAAQR